MNVAGRLAAYGVGLAVAFGAAYTIAAAITPVPAPVHAPAPTNEHAAQAPRTEASTRDPAGLSLARDGYQLSTVQAPSQVDARSVLSFSILDPTGQPLRDYQTVHDKQLHLIVVRSDGTQFAHVHPSLDRQTGEWSIPWAWKAAGTYRIFADFTPTDGAQMALTRAVDVAGTFAPAPMQGVRTLDRVDGYTVALEGNLVAGTSTELTARITRDGRPVSDLQPYMGTFGHLVALRDGDLAYLHVHPEGGEPLPGGTGGPMLRFAATAPTPGRYLLYLDFRVQGQVRTATFVVDAARASGAAPPAPSADHDAGHGGH